MSDLLARHRAVLPSWLALFYDDPIELVSGSGRRVTDADGNTYLDFFAGILTNMLGYDVPEVRDAVLRRIHGGVLHTSTLYLIRPQIELAELIADLSGIGDAKVFFTNSGTEANELALLLATNACGSDQVLTMRGAYHGRSYGATAITGIRSWKATGLSPLNVGYLHGTDRDRPPFDAMSDDEYIAFCVADLRQVIATGTANDVAALIAEPVQGVSGFTMPPDGLFAAYREVLDEYGILFISDEVQTGWGRTGEHFWGIGAHGVTPDVMTFAKGLGNGLAIGGVVARGALMDALPANLISTFGGNPIATTAGLATVRYVLDHDLQANAAVTGAIIAGALRAAAVDVPAVGAVRAKGLMIGVDLVDPATGAAAPPLAAAALEQARARGLLIGKGGLYGNTLRIAPPLTLSEAEAREGAEILVAALRAVGE